MNAFNIVITHIPRMFWAGIIGALAACIIEVLIYVFIQKRIKNFFIATYLSTATVVIGHGLPTDYFAFNKAFPDQVWSLTFSNISVNIVVLGFYIVLTSLTFKLINREHYYKSIKAL